MSRPWVLVLGPSNGDPARRVGGLPLALRLALDAQRAGAQGVLVEPESRVAPGLLDDARLRIPVSAEQPEGTRRVSAPASLLVHRDVFRIAADDADVQLAPGLQPDAPYAFPAIDVVDDRTARTAERALFRSLRKTADGWTSRHLNRHVSLAISRWLVKTPLSPNQVSVGILFVGLLGAWYAAQGSYRSLLLGALLFQAQSILDGCDGEMSRVTYRGSLLGEWLDTVGDDLTNYGFFAGAALGLAARTGSSTYLLAGAVTVGAGALTSLIEYRYLYRIGSGDLLKYPTSQTASGTGPLAKLAPLFKRDTFVFLTLVAAVVNLVGPMLVLFACAAVGILFTVLAAELRMARERRPGRQRPP